MKKIGLLFGLIAAITFSQNAFAQEKGEQKSKVIKALIVKGDALKTLQKIKLKTPAYKISKKGVLTAINGYHIRAVMYKSEAKFLLTKRTGEILDMKMDGRVEIERGVFLHCFSDKVCDACQPVLVDKAWECQTSGCPCTGEILIPNEKNISEKLAG